MPDALHLTKEYVDSAEKRAAYSVCIVGCSRRAVLYALVFAEAGFKVKVTDADQAVTRRLGKGSFRLENKEAEIKLRRFVRAEQIAASNDLKEVVAASDIIVFAVSVEVNRRKQADTSEVEHISKQVGTALPKNCIVIFAGTGGFGFTEDIVRQTLENTSGFKAGEDFGLAYVSSREMVQETGQIDLNDVLVAANDKFSLNSAASFFETITKNPVPRVMGIRKAELATLFASAKRDANMALANELAVFCEAADMDCTEVLKLIQPSPSPTIAEENNRDEAYILLDGAEALNVKLRLPAMTRQVNEDMVRHAINLAQDALRTGGKPLRRAKVSVLGGSFEAGKAALAFVEALETKGAKVTRYDPYGSSGDEEDGHSVKKTLNEAIEGTDCVVVVSETEQLRRLSLKKLHALMKSPAALVDLAGIFEPEKVEEAGFIYRGLGRGVHKK